MIKKLLRRLTGKTAVGMNELGQRRTYEAQEHGIDPSLLDDRAVQVVRTLCEHGHQAYVVGGAVRDLLLGMRPKDFDIATSATPEQTKKLFRRAYIIGRRFRIVHVVFYSGRQREVFEVSTFRARVDASDSEQVPGNEKTASRRLEGVRHAVGEQGRVLRDNVWGSLEEDAARRDFTINAMYYDPAARQVIDYHDGMRDMRDKRLRMIGDPMARYRQDPVRVIRAVRFAAKLASHGFQMDPQTAAPLVEASVLLDAVPQSRRFDEMLKLLQTGHALASVEQLRQLGFAGAIYPLLELVVQRAGQPLVHAALADTDRRVGEGKSVSPSFLLACVLWEEVRSGWEQAQASGENLTSALHTAVDAAFDAHVGEVSGRGKLGAGMREIWLLQPRFDKRRGKSPIKLVEQTRFRAAFDFLRLRAASGEIPAELADWWETFSTADRAQREQLLAAVDPGEGKSKSKRRRRRRKKKSSPDAGTTTAP